MKLQAEKKESKENIDKDKMELEISNHCLVNQDLICTADTVGSIPEKISEDENQNIQDSNNEQLKIVQTLLEEKGRVVIE